MSRFDVFASATSESFGHQHPFMPSERISFQRFYLSSNRPSLCGRNGKRPLGAKRRRESVCMCWTSVWRVRQNRSDAEVVIHCVVLA